MISSEEGYHQCTPPSRNQVCVFNDDWKSQTFNKKNLEYAHRELLKKIDDYNASKHE